MTDYPLEYTVPFCDEMLDDLRGIFNVNAEITLDLKGHCIIVRKATFYSVEINSLNEFNKKFGTLAWIGFDWESLHTHDYKLQATIHTVTY